MSEADGLRLMAVLAHPDDESLGFGGALAKYASEGVGTALVTATLGQRGRYRGHGRDAPEHPGEAELARVRERELRAAARVLGIGDLSLLGYADQDLDRADVAEAVGLIAGHIRRTRPQVVLTFAPDGGYGHPDHIAISQMTGAAIVAAGSASGPAPGHVVSKLYYLAWNAQTWDAYESSFRKLVSQVDGVARRAAPWPDWAITTVVDTERWWPTVWDAVSCHDSQMTAYARLRELTPDHHRALWGSQSFYRVFSLVNGGRRRETDLFEGLR